MHRDCAKIVPIMLSQDHHDHRIEVCQSPKQRTQNDPEFNKNITTDGKTWVNGYDTEMTVVKMKTKTQKNSTFSL